jgi:hypothetical protein
MSKALVISINYDNYSIRFIFFKINITLLPSNLFALESILLILIINLECTLLSLTIKSAVLKSNALQKVIKSVFSAVIVYSSGLEMKVFVVVNIGVLRHSISYPK